MRRPRQRPGRRQKPLRRLPLSDPYSSLLSDSLVPEVREMFLRALSIAVILGRIEDCLLGHTGTAGATDGSALWRLRPESKILARDRRVVSVTPPVRGLEVDDALFLARLVDDAAGLPVFRVGHRPPQDGELVEGPRAFAAAAFDPVHGVPFDLEDAARVRPPVLLGPLAFEEDVEPDVGDRGDHAEAGAGVVAALEVDVDVVLSLIHI